MAGVTSSAETQRGLGRMLATSIGRLAVALAVPIVAFIVLYAGFLFLRDADLARPIDELVNQLLRSPTGRRDWPLSFWSKDLLMSVAARRGWVDPDLSALP